MAIEENTPEGDRPEHVDRIETTATFTITNPGRLDGNPTHPIQSTMKCPKCGGDMGRQTYPNDGTWWCGSIKCGFELKPPTISYESPDKTYVPSEGLVMVEALEMRMDFSPQAEKRPYSEVIRLMQKGMEDFSSPAGVTDRKVLDLLWTPNNWDGYGSAKPHWITVAQALIVVRVLRERGLEPVRVAPSAAGGVGITYKTGNRKVYVESLNWNDRLYALFSDGVSNPEVMEFGEGIWERVGAYLRGDPPVRPPLTLHKASERPCEQPAWERRLCWVVVRICYALAVASVIGLAIVISWLLQTFIHWLHQ